VLEAFGLADYQNVLEMNLLGSRSRGHIRRGLSTGLRNLGK